ncbi:MAG: ATP-binding protein [Planctomycetota bacterium]
MSPPTALDALHPAVVRVSALERPGLEGDDEQLFAVFEPREDGEGPFLGLVGWHDVSRFPRRVFGDQLPRVPVEPVGEDAPLPEVLRRFAGQSRAALPVLRRDGTFRGAVTRASALQALLARGEDGQGAQVERLARDLQRLEAAALTAREVSHDLRNVLTGLSALSAVVRLGQADPGVLRQLELLTGQASLLADRLDHTSPVLPHRPQRALLEAALAELVPVLSATALGGRGVSVDLSPAGEVEVDLLDLERVLINLVVNSREVSPPAGSILVAAGREVVAEELARELRLAPGTYAWVAVRDEGPGIDEETRRRIFERGFSTKGSTPDAPRGLGLSTAQRLARRNGGALRCQSTPGAGAEFRLLLPTRG